MKDFPEFRSRSVFGFYYSWIYWVLHIENRVSEAHMYHPIETFGMTLMLLSCFLLQMFFSAQGDVNALLLMRPFYSVFLST